MSGRAKFGSWKRATIGGQSLVWKEEDVSKRQEVLPGGQSRFGKDS